jgi:glycosyltransferase involved in cell wall biosynthesis
MSQGLGAFERMRVLVVTNLYPTVTAPAKGAFVRKQVQALREADVDVALLHVHRAARGRTVYLRLWGAVRRAVEESQPDVIHVMYGGVMAAVVTAPVARAPVVVTFYGSDLLAAHANTRGFMRVSALLGVHASTYAAVRASGIVVQSQVLADALPRQVDRSRVWIIPDGIDLDEFAPRDRYTCQKALGWDPAQKHVLFPAARTVAAKRFELAEAAMSRLTSAGHAVRLHELDGVPHAEVPTWLNASNLVVLTSTHEGSPNVVKEALACNVAVVSVDVGDVRERLKGIEGCFVAASTPEDVAAKMALALEHDRVSSRASMAELSAGHVAQQLIGVYEVVIGSARPG